MDLLLRAPDSRSKMPSASTPYSIMSPSRSLQDPRDFSSFASCADENSIGLLYYSTEVRYYFRPSRDWCLPAGVARVEYFIRLWLHVCGKPGHEFPGAFHAEGHEESYLDQY